jgi:hypothetical protein
MMPSPFFCPSRRTGVTPTAAALKGDAVLASILMVLSAAIILALGVLHLIYTFSGKKLTPRDPALQVRMAQVSPVITRQTTMWKGWVGFNASHSYGAILFGLVYGYLAVVHREILFNSPFLLAVGLAMLGGWLFIGKVYFFSTPFRGILLATICYVLSVVARLSI